MTLSTLLIAQAILTQYKMEASSFDSGQDNFNINNVSLNETANSVHIDYGQKDREMKELNDMIVGFIKEKLEESSEFMYGDFQQNPMVTKHPHQVIKPYPNVYFLPKTILYTSQKTDIQQICRSLQQIQRSEYQIRYNREKKQLNITIHNKLELLFYSLRALKTDSKLHRDPKMLDSKHLIDKLFQYYSHFYKKLYFYETSVVILYWAYQHDLLNHTISQQALKLLIICNFINFGYGVQNICQLQSTNESKLAMSKKMISYLKINRTGESQIQEELTAQFYNYTIQQKRGFYLVSKKKFMQIKDIIPVFFPLLPIQQKEEALKIANAVQKGIQSTLKHHTQMFSICKNVSKMFRFLHNKFEKSMKLVIDFGESSAYRSEYSSSFELEVLHPVLNTSLCKIKDGDVKQLTREINYIHEKFVQNQQPLQILNYMLQKVRR